MANSRMYLRHKSTGNRILLVKWGFGWACTVCADTNALNDFFDKCQSESNSVEKPHYGDKFILWASPGLGEDESPDKCPFELYME